MKGDIDHAFTFHHHKKQIIECFHGVSTNIIVHLERREKRKMQISHFSVRQKEF